MVNEQKHGTAEICDLYSSEVRVLNTELKSFGAIQSCFGEIVTVKLDEDNRILKDLLQTAGEQRIVCVDVGAIFCAVVGDNLASYAIDNFWSGIFINGYVRDTKMLSTMPIGVWALGTCPKRSLKREEGRCDVPINIGGVEVETGSFLYADEDGIVIANNELEDINFAI